MPPARADAYRRSQREGPDPTTEEDATAELIQRSTALRRRLLALTIAASVIAGTSAVALYAATAGDLNGRVAGVLFAAGALAVFAVLHSVSRAAARGMEARWAGELSRRLNVSAEPLKAALQMLD